MLNFAVHSQPAWRIDQLSVADGLSQGYVYFIHQDKKGFIWIGTHGGLNRYDGYRFKVSEYRPFDSTTLADNAVFFLREDNATGKFWMGGSSSLNEFDPETFTNRRYRYEAKQLEFADGVFINDHELLLACEYAVLLFDTQTKSFREIPVYEDGRLLSITRVENAAADRNGNFMVMSRTGVFFYDPESGTCQRKTKTSPDFSAFRGLEIFNVLHDSRGYYWIATNRSGLIRFEPRSGETTVLPLSPPLKNESVRFDVVYEDSRGNIWAGSSDGLFRIDPISLRSERFSSEGSDTGVRLSHSEINAITEDRNHFMWIGTVGSGLNKMIPRSAGFRNINLSRNINGTPTGTYVMALQQLGDDIWFSNIWDQVGKVNLQSGRTTVVTHLFEPDYSWYSEGAIIKNSANEISILNGEYRFAVTQENNGQAMVKSSSAPGLYYIHHAGNGKTWMMVKAPVERTFQRNDTIYGNQFFYDVEEDRDANLWIGSSKGLIRFDPQQNSFIHYRHDDSNTNSVSSDFIYSLEIDDSNENIWMAAYNGGLCSFNMSTGTFTNYTTDDGLSDNTVYAIEKDQHGNLWFSSDAGISAYDVRKGTFRNYGVADGLLNSEFNRRSSFTNNDGWLFFGGVSGIDYFHPDSIVKDNISSNLAFTGFRVLNNDVVPGKRNGSPVIELKPYGRHVTVEFSALDYSDQRKIQYAYRVNDGEWITTGYQSTLSFSDLASGPHYVSVRSTNSEGIWLDNAIHCLLVVQPWWWEAWWFRIATGIFALGVLLMAIRFYYHRKLEKQKIALERRQVVEKERTRIATDMHDDLGASLSRIKFLSETIGIKKQKQEAIEEEVGDIRRYAHEMIDKMGEIVWALNEKNDSLNDLLSYTRSYAVGYLSENGIESHVETSEAAINHFVTGEFRRNVYLVVKEALHNIVKHAQATRVDMRVVVGDALSITIRDDGIGFDEANRKPYSNGISNMKARIAGLGGQFEIGTGKGTRILIRVPLPNLSSISATAGKAYIHGEQ